MKVDVKGNVYCTGPSGIHVFAPDGRMLGRIKVPGQVNNLAFGDADLCSLYAVTQTSVFRTRMGVPGLPA